MWQNRPINRTSQRLPDSSAMGRKHRERCANEVFWTHTHTHTLSHTHSLTHTHTGSKVAGRGGGQMWAGALSSSQLTFTRSTLCSGGQQFLSPRPPGNQEPQLRP